MPLDNQTHIFEKIIDATPGLIDKIQSMFPNQGGTGAGQQQYTPTPPPVPANDVTFTPSATV